MFDSLPFCLATRFDPESLRAYALQPLQVEAALLYLKARLRYFSATSPAYIQCLTQRALLLRLKPDYPASIQDFETLIAYWQTQQLPEAAHRLLANRLRLANTYHLARDFALSNLAFETLLAESVHWSPETRQAYEHFLWQHAGKNAYDQARWSEATDFFEKALTVRQSLNDAELIASSQLALQQALKKSRL